MTRREKVVYGNIKDNLNTIMQKIGDTKHSRLPIINDQNRVLGIVDSVDINNLIAKVLK